MIKSATSVHQTGPLLGRRMSDGLAYIVDMEYNLCHVDDIFILPINPF